MSISPFPPETNPFASATFEELSQLIVDARSIEARDIADAWPEPEPMTELPPVPAFDLGLLPESVKPLVEDTSERMQTPPDFPAAATVLSLAGITNRRAVIQPQASDSSWVVVPNLWGALIGPPSVMKSPIMNAITQPIAQLDALWRAEHETALHDYKTEKEQMELRQTAWRESYKVAIKKNEAPPLRPDESIAEPVLRRIITQDATPEKLHEILRDNQAGVLIIRDELSGWFSTLEKQGREGERAFFLSAWNGDTGHTIDRIGRGSIYVPACCVSIMGALTPGRVRVYLEDSLRDGPSNDGLMQRFQVCVWPDIGTHWRYIDRPANAQAIIRVADVFRKIAQLDAAFPLRLRFAQDAQELFVQWRTDLENRLRSGELGGVMQSHLGKYRSLMPSLALLFELADGGSESVSLHHARLAAGWCSYLEEHAKRIYAARPTLKQSAAHTLARKISAGWQRAEGRFTLRDVYRNGWTGLSDPDECRAALRQLEQANWLRREPTEGGVGRPSEVYQINPRIEASN